MGRKTNIWSVMLLFLTAVLITGVSNCAMYGKKETPAVPRMSVEELKSRLGDPSLAVIDVRQPHDWDKSSIKIKGAVREDPAQVSAWAAGYPKDKTIVLYCA